MRKRILVSILCCILMTVLCACGSSIYKNSMGTATGDTYASNNMIKEEAGQMNGVGSNLDSTAFSGTDAKIIYTADISMETTEFDSTVTSLKQLVAETGGYFENSSVDNYSTYRCGSYTVRIPSERYREFCDQVGAICHVTHFNENADDISETYYDTKARLETQQTKLKRLQELLAQAESMADIITIEDAISETEMEIESLSGTLRHYDLLVGYSTVDISLNEVYKLSNVEEPAIGFGAKLASAFKGGIASFVEGVQFLLLALAYSLPVLVVIAVIAAAVVAVCVKHKNKHKNKKENKKETV